VLITFMAYIVLLPFIPFMFMFVFLVSVFSKSKKISFSKFLRFVHKVKNGRKQQNIQNTYYSRA
jgi:hypothetical protein